jgi:hypothetical protein
MEKDFDKEAKLFVKKIMLENELNFIELTKKLNDAGFMYSEASVRQKISRGRFDFAFLLQVADVLGYKVEMEKYRPTP